MSKLTVRNFRAIGKDPVTVELDDIVVLVGPNNSGKSSILRAYQVVMLHGSKEGELTKEDFPNGVVDPENPVEIELETVVYDQKAPGEKWIRKDPKTNDMFVREKWIWTEPGKPKKVGWEVGEPGSWHKNEGPWGLPGVAQPARPEPHRIEAFDPPEKQAAEVVKLLKEVLNQRIKEKQEEPVESGDGSGQNDYRKLLKSVSDFQKKVVQDANEQIGKVELEMNSLIGQVFPGQEVSFDARPEEDIDNCLTFFRDTPQLLMGPKGGYKPPIEKQGSGARRTLLWAALRLLKEQARAKKDATSTRPHILLIDEPELCLHPSAIREACRVLYDLPAKTGNWQVMITTHSPTFIDFWRDNTSIVRVERKTDGSSGGVTIFRPKRASFDDDDKACLKLLNFCDPYVAEFFFGGRSIVVEGDTEYSAFNFVMQLEPERFKGVHVVRARGKATIVSLCKILNQFGAPYSVLHDSDLPTAIRMGKSMVNPAWSQNQKILDQVKDLAAQKKVRLVASLINFEAAYLGCESTTEKPTTAWTHLKENEASRRCVSSLLDALIDFDKPLPQGATEWSDLAALKNLLPSSKA